MAAAIGSISALKQSLERGADLCKGNALRFAITRDDHWKEAMEVLLDHGVDINMFSPQASRVFKGGGTMLQALCCILLLQETYMIGFPF